ncbi:MAG TPA: hypothetical protein DCZ08_01070 [Anaerolineaceae bacterium]|nr:hypothetical protein [Anaerolineaceae bacterium]
MFLSIYFSENNKWKIGRLPQVSQTYISTNKDAMRLESTSNYLHYRKKRWIVKFEDILYRVILKSPENRLNLRPL